MFDVLCGSCGAKMLVSRDGCEGVELACKNCNKILNGNFVKCFFDDKYIGKIRCVEITNSNSATIYFEGK